MVVVPGGGAVNVQLDTDVQGLLTVPFMLHIAKPVLIAVDETVKGVPALTT